MRRREGARIRALLLIGPTGSGKSPLGDVLERLSGWAHLDFGALLREVASGKAVSGLSHSDREFVRRLLRENALFPEDAFPIVGTLLGGFVAGRDDPAGLILNGLPRHVSQAESLSAYVDVEHVAFLNAAPEIAAARVARRRLGGSADHSGRADDTSDDFRRKIAIFNERTRPLLEHYSSKAVPITELPIESAETGEEELASRLLEGGWQPGP